MGNLLQNYTANARETLLEISPIPNTFSYLVMGFNGEMSELKYELWKSEGSIETKVIKVQKELGDCFWYFSQIVESDILQFEFYPFIENVLSMGNFVHSYTEQYYFNKDYFFLDLEKELQLFNGRIKRIFRDFETPEDWQKSNLPMSSVGGILQNLSGFLISLSLVYSEGDMSYYVREGATNSGGYKTSLEKTLQSNLQKLKKRKKAGTLKGEGNNR